MPASAVFCSSACSSETPVAPAAYVHTLAAYCERSGMDSEQWTPDHPTAEAETELPSRQGGQSGSLSLKSESDLQADLTAQIIP